MKANLKHIRKYRVYSVELKRSIVASFERGEFSVAQIEKLYGISNVSIYKWIYKFSLFNEKGCRIVEMKSSSQEKLKQLSERVRELEQKVGQKQIAIEYLEKMIELAKTELDIDIKKNYASQLSTGSGPTKRKESLR